MNHMNTRSIGGPPGPNFLSATLPASLTSSFAPFGRSGRVTHADVSMMHVSMMHVSMMHVSMIHVSMMYVSMMHVSMIHVSMMHVSMTYVPMTHVSIVPKTSVFAQKSDFGQRLVL